MGPTADIRLPALNFRNRCRAVAHRHLPKDCNGSTAVPPLPIALLETCRS
jgi:hypothetical protein